MERKYWIDFAKVFGIFLVVLGHFTPHYREVFSSQWLYQFHIPLFFIIGGYLCKESNAPIWQQYKAILLRLFVPYVLLVVIGWGVDDILKPDITISGGVNHW